MNGDDVVVLRGFVLGIKVHGRQWRHAPQLDVHVQVPARPALLVPHVPFPRRVDVRAGERVELGHAERLDEVVVVGRREHPRDLQVARADEAEEECRGCRDDGDDQQHLKHGARAESETKEPAFTTSVHGRQMREELVVRGRRRGGPVVGSCRKSTTRFARATRRCRPQLERRRCVVTWVTSREEYLASLRPGSVLRFVATTNQPPDEDDATESADQCSHDDSDEFVDCATKLYKPRELCNLIYLFLNLYERQYNTPRPPPLSLSSYGGDLAADVYILSPSWNISSVIIRLKPWLERELH